MPCIKTYTESLAPSNKDYIRLINFDLQLFSQEKTEEATPKRKSDARNKGQVAKSVEINSAFIILAAFLALKLVSPMIYLELSNYMRLVFSNIARNDFTITEAHVLFIDFAIVFLKTALPVMVVILIISLAANMLQVGFNFTLEPIMPNFGKLNPLTGFQRLFSKRSLVELVKSFIKIAVVGYFIYQFILKETLELPKLINLELIESLQLAGGLILDLAFQIGAVILVLAVLDYFYQWWQHNESLKMSKQEVKDLL